MVVAVWWWSLFGGGRCLVVGLVVVAVWCTLFQTTRSATDIDRMSPLAVQCGSCLKRFSRSDAMKRHQTLNRCRGPPTSKTERDVESRKQRTEAEIQIDGGESHSLRRDNEGAWPCPRCHQSFSRPDAVHRHLNSACKGHDADAYFLPSSLVYVEFRRIRRPVPINPILRSSTRHHSNPQFLLLAQKRSCARGTHYVENPPGMRALKP